MDTISQFIIGETVFFTQPIYSSQVFLVTHSREPNTLALSLSLSLSLCLSVSLSLCLSVFALCVYLAFRIGVLLDAPVDPPQRAVGCLGEARVVLRLRRHHVVERHHDVGADLGTRARC